MCFYIEALSDSKQIHLLHQLFSDSARRFPQALALDSAEGGMTYQELEARSNQLAHCLSQQGAEAGSCVGLLFPRSAELYIALLAILKAGCAYVPIDPAAPAERRRYILEDCQATMVLSNSSLGLEGVLAVDQLDLSGFPCHPPEIGLQPADLAYLIYTSGTTGRPKGCMIEHRNAVHLVRAEQELYGFSQKDRIFQFASVTFDASVEEIWMAFANGATLVWSKASVVSSAPDFAKHMDCLGVTVLSCVPTFLAMVEQDMPTIHTLILGGETCSTALVSRWARSGRTLWNTYGPTETTVVATAIALTPDQPLTIGRPLKGYTIHLLDEQLQPVQAGERGEICIGGPGVARGYLNRPELTAEKFITLPELGRLYRSADLARWNPQGTLEYLGRNDAQVKVRGYRVELSEVEAVLLETPGILAAAVRVESESQRLAAFYVASREQRPDIPALCQNLRSRLPAYMVPATLDEIEQIPRTIAGKVDRASLPEARNPLIRSRQSIAPRNAAEECVCSVFAQILQTAEISAEDDFFKDLGGHSMLAAKAVSELRHKAEFAHLSVGDLYAHPSAAELAPLAREGQRGSRETFVSSHPLQHFLCGCAQAFGLIILAGVYAWQWLGAYLTYGYLYVSDQWSVSEALLGAIMVNVLTTPTLLALAVVIKWVFLGRIRPGQHRLWGWYYWRFWFVRGLLRASPVQYLSGTPWLNLFYRLMGARIGPGVYLAGHGLTSFDLCEIGAGSSIGCDSSIEGSTIENGMLRLGRIQVGRDCWVGNRSSLGLDSVMEDGAGLDDLSMLPDGGVIPAGKLWSGSPARPKGEMETLSARNPWSIPLAVAQAGGIVILPMLVLCAVFPGWMLITHLGHADDGFRFLALAPVIAVLFVVSLCFEIWALKWLVLGRLKAACRPVRSLHFFRVWLVDKALDLSLEVVGTLYTTMYVRPWLLALGGKIGRRTEISTIRFLQPDLITTGQECFLADDVSVGAANVRGGWITHEQTTLGSRTFLGNGAVIPAGSQIGSNVLIGLLSLPPQESVADNTTWFGSPARPLAARQRPCENSENLTYKPPAKMVGLRLFIEFFRIILPSTFFVILASLIINATDILQDYVGHGEWLLLLPFLYLAAAAVAILLTAAMKWVLVGHYKPEEHPLWCAWIWRSELVTGVFENFGVMFFVDLLRGTVFLPWVLRLFGMKLGKRCYIDTTWFTEFDLVELGDEVALNENANIQTHLFQDRVMTTGPVQIGSRSVVGAMSTVLYFTRLGEGSRLGDLSLVMKGESLPENSCWQGAPAQYLG